MEISRTHSFLCSAVNSRVVSVMNVCDPVNWTEGLRTARNAKFYGCPHGIDAVTMMITSA